MKSEPEISVILSTYRRNYGDGKCDNFLKRALQSILTQTFSHFELILIDDGSNDGTAEMCQRYAEDDTRVRYIRFETNSGLPAKRYNQGISLSHGKWVAFMFDDDEWLPNALEDLYQSIVSLPSIYGMVHGTAYYTYVDGTLIAADFGSESVSVKKMLTQNKICNNTVLIKKNVFDLVGGYDESLCMRRICDWDLWLRIAMRYKIHSIPKRVARVYQGLPDSLLNNVALNHSLVYARQLLFFRKQPLRKYYFQMSPEQWRHFLSHLCQMPCYIFIRLCNHAFTRTSKIKRFVPKKVIKIIKFFMRRL